MANSPTCRYTTVLYVVTLVHVYTPRYCRERLCKFAYGIWNHYSKGGATDMEPEKQAQPPPYSPEQYPAGQYPPPHPQPQPQPYPTQQYYPQYPAGPVGVQPAPAPGPYAPASGELSDRI